MLVGYSSSDSEVESPPRLSSSLKRKRESDKASALPPLPAAFHDLYASAARTTTSDDPSLHGGRKRAVPHIEGNWPSHVYLEWHPSSTEITMLNALLSEVETSLKSNGVTKSSLHSLVTSDLGAPLPLHISLSPPLSLPTDGRDIFLDRLTQAIDKKCNLEPFQVSLAGLDWSPNETFTRWFLVLRAAKPLNDGLNRLLQACNQVAASFKLPQLYSNSRSHQPAGSAKAGSGGTVGTTALRNNNDSLASTTVPKDSSDCTSCFHFSIAWTLEKPPDEQAVNRADKAAMPNTGQMLDTKVMLDAVKVKIGNTVTSLALGSKTVDSRGMLG